MLYAIIAIILILIGRKKWRKLGWVLLGWGVWTGGWTIPFLFRWGEPEWTSSLLVALLQSLVCLSIGWTLLKKNPKKRKK